MPHSHRAFFWALMKHTFLLTMYGKDSGRQAQPLSADWFPQVAFLQPSALHAKSSIHTSEWGPKPAGVAAATYTGVKSMAAFELGNGICVMTDQAQPTQKSALLKLCR